MFRRSLRLIEASYKARLAYDIVSKKNSIILKISSRGNSTLTLVNRPTFIIPFLTNPLLCNEHNQQEIKIPKHSTIYSGLDISLPSMENLTINIPSITFNKNNRTDYFEEETLDIQNEGEKYHTYWMGSLLKKRRRKMNRQKYKKRRKRDRFKREALKNLREKKQQRKERAAERKQAILSKMVVNKSISKRRARYLSHKLLPGVIKGQGLV